MIDNTTFAVNHQPQGLQDERLAEVLDEYLSALEQGTSIDLEKIVLDNPELEDDIRGFTQSLNILYQATQTIRGEDSSAAKGQQIKLLGDFEIGPEIGRGGMGVVYEARQLSLNRKVALKVLPFAAMWDEKQVARFRNEAQAAAQLHHPHIVPVFAVGQERGVHFYAMQFVAGRSLAEVVQGLQHCDKEKVSIEKHSRVATNSTLGVATTWNTAEPPCEFSHEFSQAHSGYCRKIARLGIQAAEAVHYAHECGVVHRDIKPSNLLLDSQGKLWITDFGLARMQNNPSITVTGDIVGTLRYMSPEQATGQHALVDQRTDVYALGATLYELLTLQAAFPGEDRHRVLSAIEQDEPSSLRSINPSIPADLETIVLQAMAKSRDTRYSTAQDLAEDLDRFLQGKPTVARRPTAVDRAAKWIRRHRYAAAAAMLVLVAIATISSIGAILLARETAQKEAALVTAEQNLNHARLVVDRFGTHFSRELERLPGSEPLQRELLQDTLSYYKEFLTNSSQEPELKTELARTAFKTAGIARRLGRPNEAREFYSKALQLFEQLSLSTGIRNSHFQDRATCHNELGLLEMSQGNVLQAKEHYQAAIRQQSELVKSEKYGPEAVRTLAEMQINLGLLHRQTRDTNQAKSSIQPAIDLLQQLSERHPGEARHAHDLAIALNNLSFVEQESDWPAARNSCQAAVEILQGLLKDRHKLSREMYSGSTEQRSDLALCYNNLGAIESHLGQHQKACHLHRKAIELQEQLSRQAPAIVRYCSELAVSWNNLGQSLVQAGEVAESSTAFEQAQEIMSKLAEDFPTEVSFLSSLAGVLNNQAMALESAGDLAHALKLYESAIQHQREVLKQAPQLASCRENLNKHYINYGRVLRKVGRPIDSAEVARKRRNLWATDGQHLYHVARELAQSASQLDKNLKHTDEKKRMADDAILMLQQALSAQTRPLSRSFNTTDFLAFKDYADFRNLVSEKE